MNDSNSTTTAPAPGPPAPVQPESPRAPVDSDGRRRFLQACIGGATVVSAGTIAYPVATFLKLPQTLSEAQTIKIPIDSLNEDQAVYKEKQGVPLVVIYTGRKPKVFDATCTHLGCIVAWDGTTHEFHCPCHGATFDDQGRPLSGPVSRPLATVEAKIEKGNLVIA